MLIGAILVIILLLIIPGAVSAITGVSEGRPTYQVIMSENVVGETQSQTFFPITPVEVTPTVQSSWQDIDASFYIPIGATGVLLHVANTNAIIDQTFGLRKNQSTDNRTQVVGNAKHCWAAIGVDENRIFECRVGSTTSIDVYLVGYTGTGVTFFTNAYNKSISKTGVWTDVRCSSEAPGAVGLIFELERTPISATNFGLRKNGSVDNRVSYLAHHTGFGAIIGCDSNQICEVYQMSSVGLYLVGYITDGATFYTDALSFTPSSTGVWCNLPTLPSDAVMGFIEVHDTNTRLGTYYGLRNGGSSENIYYKARHPWAFVECDTDGTIEGKIGTTDISFWLVGYANV